MAAREGQSAYSMKLVGSGALATGLAVLSTVEWVVVARAGARERPLPLYPSKHCVGYLPNVGQSLWAQTCSSMSVCAFVLCLGSEPIDTYSDALALRLTSLRLIDGECL